VANWTKIQGSTSQNSTSGGTESLAYTFGSIVTAGNVIVVRFAIDDVAETVTLSDSESNAYTKLVETPSNLDPVGCLYAAIQAPTAICTPFTGGGSTSDAGVEVWTYAMHPQQPAGKGDGSTASNGQAITNLFWQTTGAAQHLNNASPKLQAWRDWANAANPLPYSPPGPLLSSSSRPPAKRWLPGLRAPRISLGAP
jgi:hypothetical protein